MIALRLSKIVSVITLTVPPYYRFTLFIHPHIRLGFVNKVWWVITIHERVLVSHYVSGISCFKEQYHSRPMCVTRVNIISVMACNIHEYIYCSVNAAHHQSMTELDAVMTSFKVCCPSPIYAHTICSMEITYINALFQLATLFFCK